MLQKIHNKGTRFVDESGRTVILRGVNLGGDCKIPYPNGGTYIPTDFSDHRDVSFIGRPFPLNEAETHFARLRNWGFNCLRLLVTWEAVEHRGPSEYDIAFIDYYSQLCKMAGEYGLYVFVDFHQDVWSRMTGGDGAPGWLFEKLGIDFRTFHDADMALIMQHRYNPQDPTPFQKNYPAMSWNQNYGYPINGLMWTLFFGGADFVPDFKVDGMDIQTYMQSHYIGCQVKIAEKIRDLPNVLGFGSLNEPSKGWIEYPMNDRHLDMRPNDPPTPGIAMSPVDALLLSHGHALELPFLDISIRKMGLAPKKQVILNAKRIPIWKDNSTDPFIQSGIYSIDADGSASIHKNTVFTQKAGRPIDFDADYLLPFCHKITNKLHAFNPDWMLFVEKDAKMAMFRPGFPTNMPPKMVNATHWYDGALNYLKKVLPFNIDIQQLKFYIGYNQIQRFYMDQVGKIKQASVQANCPTLIGEFGMLFDINNRKAYHAWQSGNHQPSIWKTHNTVFNRMYNAMDRHLLSCTQWTYTASNLNDPKIGDGWNQEDCSVFSTDQQDDPHDLNSGGRALEGIVRPFPHAIQGNLVEMIFDIKKKRYMLRFELDANIIAPSLLFIPKIQYPNGIRVNLPSDQWQWQYENLSQILTITTNNPQEWHNKQITLEILPK